MFSSAAWSINVSLLNKHVSTVAENFNSHRSLRWPNTVFARAFADAIQHAHKDCKNKHVLKRVIFLFIQNPHYLRYFSLLLNAVY